MRTHAALLRGVNVGGNNRVPMGELRDLVERLGHREVETYIQSGNVVFGAGARRPDKLESELEAAIEKQLGVACGVVVVAKKELAGIAAANPFPDYGDPRRLHVVFRSPRSGPLDEPAVAAAAERARAKGSPDQVVVRGAVMYLLTPEGIGRSDLAAQLSRGSLGGGTARNWATVAKLLDLLGG